MKAIIITIIIAVWVLLTWALARAAGLASREEERWAESEQTDEDD